MSNYASITMIDSLPDLEEVERGGYNQNRNVNSYQDQNYGNRDQNFGEDRQDMGELKVHKFIRGQAPINPQSGMNPHGGNDPRFGMNPAFPRPQMGGMEQIGQIEAFQHVPLKAQGVDPMSFSCIDISKHISSCPICSKFYNNDKSVYILAIAVLTILCILLLKRVINV